VFSGDWESKHCLFQAYFWCRYVPFSNSFESYFNPNLPLCGSTTNMDMLRGNSTGFLNFVNNKGKLSTNLSEKDLPQTITVRFLETVET